MQQDVFRSSDLVQPLSLNDSWQRGGRLLVTCPYLEARWSGVQKLPSAAWGSEPFSSSTEVTSL